MHNKSLGLTCVATVVAITFGWSQRQQPPEGSAPKDFTLPSRTSFGLENGLKASLVQFGVVPKVTVRVVVRTGNANEGPDEIWLADLTGTFMKEGTSTRTARQIAEEAARMGGTITVGVTDEETTFGGDVLSEFGPQLVALLADIVGNPGFPESELPRLKNDAVRRLSISRTDPEALATEKFRSVMFPGHAYGRVYPTEGMLRGYSMEQVRAFYRSNMGAARTRVYVAGMFDAKSVEKSVRESFKEFVRGPDPLVNIPTPSSRREIHIIDRPGAPQSTVEIGLPSIDPTHEDYRALLVADALLGGAFGSRITANIRENKGYSYSPFSTVVPLYRAGYWYEFASVTSGATGPSLKEIFHEINRLRDEKPTLEELRGIQNNLAGLFVLQNSSPGGIITRLAFLNLHGLPDEYLTTFVRAIYAVTPEEIQRIARTYFRADLMQIVIAGDRKSIAPQVAPYGKIAG